MRVLMLTQALDPADPLLAFTVDWVRALARRVSHVDVICLRASGPPPASNVTAWPIGERHEASRMRRLVALERAVLRLVGKADVVFTHMVPRYACCAGPIAAAARRPLLLWYVHRRDSLELRIASRFSRIVATAAPQTLPFATDKLRPLGHGVNSGFFSPGEAPSAASPPEILFVGRVAPIKRQDALVRALSHLDRAHGDVRVAFVGGVANRQYDASVRALATEIGWAERVQFAGPQSAAGVREACRRATVAVNLSPDGLFDKAAIESMMVGTPTVVASSAFDHLLGEEAAALRVGPTADPPALGAALNRLLALPAAERQRMAAAVRRRTIEAHALDGLMDRLVACMQTMTGGAR
jgi:glycosyltransferase involved in cell wall biosynthesis